MTPPVVLILEGSPELRKMLEDGLEQRGYAVRSAANPAQALELLRDGRALLVIADPPAFTEPDGPTLDAIHREFPAVPTIVMSPDAFDPSILEKPRPGEAPRRLLRKPFTLQQLLSLTERLLPSNASAPQRP